MMNNTTEIFATLYLAGLSLANYAPSVLSFATIIYVGKFVFDWRLKNQSADTQFLRNDIYSPLYEDIKKVGENISNFEDCYSTGLPSKIGTVRVSLINIGKYSSIPKNLQKDIDSYYERCEEYHKQFKSVDEEIIKIITLEIRKIRTEEDHEKFFHGNEYIEGMVFTILSRKFLMEGQLPINMPQLNDRCKYMIIHVYFSQYSNKWDNTVTIDDLNRNSLYIKDLLESLIGLVNQKTTVAKLRALQQQLINHEKLLLKKIEKRIRYPNPLIEKLGI